MAPAGLPMAPARADVALHLAPSADLPAAQRETPHFLLRYDADRLSPKMVDAAAAAAEEGYARCAKVFPVGGLKRRVTVNLTPRFLGATGFAAPEEYSISIRATELDYLGLPIGYVMTHELAHIFTYVELQAMGAGRGVVTGAWGEGMADFATGSFGDIRMEDWWARALTDSGIWADPAWLVDGSEAPRTEDFVCERTSTYEQAALFIRFLTEKFGPNAVYRFYAEYSTAVAHRDAGRGRRRPGGETRHAELAAIFRTHFGATGEALLTRWQERLDAANVPAGPAERLSLHERIYGSLREFETQYARDRRHGIADEAMAAAVREQFRLANRALQNGDLPAAADYLRSALAREKARPAEESAVALWAAPRAR